MNRLNLARLIYVAGAVAACVGATQAPAQSADALLDKLVEKGILSAQEAQDLKKESDKGFTKAYSAKTGIPAWVDGFQFHGDFRGRYEGFFFENSDAVNRTRYRYRLRVGATASLRDNFELGFRLTSSEPSDNFGGDPISGNSTFRDNGSKKFIYIDLAYGKWSPLKEGDWKLSTIIGKMANPFSFSDMVFDPDYTPEGAAIQLGYALNEKHSLKLNAGGFVMDEIGGSNNDPYWLGAQARLESEWSKRLKTSFGAAALMIDNDQMLNASTNTPRAWTIPNSNGGNSRSGTVGSTYGNLANHFNPLIADGSATYTLEQFWLYNGAFPISAGADYMYNPAASHQNVGYSLGFQLGKSGKKGQWDLSYRYKYLEGDAWFEEFVDSDFGAFYAASSSRTGGGSGYIAGTNVKGHIFKFSYSPFDCLTLGATAFFTEAIQKSPEDSESGTTRLQVDASLKF